jgi:TolB-like protein
MKSRWIVHFFILTLLLGSVPIFATATWAQARDSQKVYKVAILPFLIHSQENLDYLREGINDILVSRITVEGRITVIDRSQVERALHEERPTRLDEAVAIKVGTKVGADYIVLGSITKVGEYISLDAQLLSITEDKPPLTVFTQTKGIDDVMVKIGTFAEDIGFKIIGRRIATGRSMDSGRSPQIIRERGKFAQEGFKRSQNLAFEIRGVDVGDVDGDKKNEVVAMDRHNLYIFRYDGEKLTLFQKIEAGYEYDLLTLDVADVNRNGHAEIIVSALVNENLRSFILEFEEGKFRKITEKTGWFFRVLEHPKEGPILMGQVMSSQGLPAGDIYKMVWKKRSFERGPKISFPGLRGDIRELDSSIEANLFGLALGDVRGTGKPDLVFIDTFGHVNILSEDGKDVWRGRDRFGGTNNFYETKKKKVEPYRPGESPPYRLYIQGRILVKDLDGDGMKEIIVNKNEFLSGTVFEKTRAYEKGEVYSLVWEENRLITNWKTVEIKGYIADYQVKEVGNSGEPELVVAVVLIEEGVGSVFSKKTESNILFFKLN